MTDALPLAHRRSLSLCILVPISLAPAIFLRLESGGATPSSDASALGAPARLGGVAGA